MINSHLVNKIDSLSRFSFYYTFFWFLTVSSMLIVAILYLNDGVLLFTLDDPYIHLALAEQLLQGNYGVNAGEYSAPSSSVLWPFIIAPLVAIGYETYLILLLNLLLGFLSVLLVIKTFIKHYDLNALDREQKTSQRMLVLILVPCLLICMNVLGLAFTGMEHSLQLYLSLYIVAALLNEMKFNQVNMIAFVVIAIVPLIRYECLAISLPVLAYLFLRGYRLQSILTAAFMVTGLLLFAWFLVSLDLTPFPTSIMAKSDIVETSGRLGSIVSNFLQNVSLSRGVMMSLMVIVLFGFAFNKKFQVVNENASPKVESEIDTLGFWSLGFLNDFLTNIAKQVYAKRLFCFMLACSGVLHLFIGKFGWFNRYEVYMWSSLLFAILIISIPYYKHLPQKMGNFISIVYLFCSTSLICWLYFAGLFMVPKATNNIYEQQYQMSRFAQEYYKKPIAVNDLGLVVFKNNDYVLDLWGLASVEALSLRTSDDRSNWMQSIVSKNNVELAIIYDEWFDGDIPERWIKIAQMSISKNAISIAGQTVSFYATSCHHAKVVKLQLIAFKESLPKPVNFALIDTKCS